MKRNGKKIFLMLLILTLVGVVGYGVYSYYWASGSVTHTGTIEIDGFDVSLYNRSNSDGPFINGNISSDLECKYSSSSETFICEDSFTVYNRGTNDVSVLIENLDVDISGIDDASIVDSSISWRLGNVIPVDNGSEYSFDIIVEIEIPGYEEPSDEAVQLTEAITGGELEVNAHYDIIATEV